MMTLDFRFPCGLVGFSLVLQCRVMLDCILQFKHYVINIWFCLNPIENGDIFV